MIVKSIYVFPSGKVLPLSLSIAFKMPDVWWLKTYGELPCLRVRNIRECRWVIVTNDDGQHVPKPVYRPYHPGDFLSRKGAEVRCTHRNTFCA